MAAWEARRDFLKRTLVWTLATSWVGAAGNLRAQGAPQLLNYQGRLTDAGGNPRNGTFAMSFAILGGLSAWSENQTVAVSNGFFSVLLGSVTPFPADLFVGGSVDAVRMTLERTPPELAADVMDKGIILAGGGSLMRGLDLLLARETNMPIHIAEDPLTAVVRGTGVALEHFDLLRRVAITSRKVSG